MQDKIKIYQEKFTQFGRRLHDPKFAGVIVFTVILVLISWSGVKTIQTNYELQKQISELSQQNQVQKLSNANSQLENEYYNTSTYQELVARQNFGLAAPGEKEIIVPKSVALGYTVAPKPTAQIVDKPSDKQPSDQRHFEAWVNFFLHRQSAGS